MARNLRPGDPYVHAATVISKLGPVTYMVKTQDGQSWKRHVEQLKDLATSHSPTPVTTTSITDNAGDVTEYPTPEVHDTSTESSESAEITQAQPDSVEPVNETPQVLEGSSPSATPTVLVYFQHIVLDLVEANQTLYVAVASATTYTGQHLLLHEECMY